MNVTGLVAVFLVLAVLFQSKPLPGSAVDRMLPPACQLVQP